MKKQSWRGKRPICLNSERGKHPRILYLRSFSSKRGYSGKSSNWPLGLCWSAFKETERSSWDTVLRMRRGSWKGMRISLEICWRNRLRNRERPNSSWSTLWARERSRVIRKSWESWELRLTNRNLTRWCRGSPKSMVVVKTTVRWAIWVGLSTEIVPLGIQFKGKGKIQTEYNPRGLIFWKHQQGSSLVSRQQHFPHYTEVKALLLPLKRRKSWISCFTIPVHSRVPWVTTLDLSFSTRKRAQWSPSNRSTRISCLKTLRKSLSCNSKSMISFPSSLRESNKIVLRQLKIYRKPLWTKRKALVALKLEGLAKLWRIQEEASHEKYIYLY